MWAFLEWAWQALLAGRDKAGEWMQFYYDFVVGWWSRITPVEYVIVITLIAAAGFLLMGAKQRGRL